MKIRNLIIIFCFCYGALEKPNIEAKSGHIPNNVQLELVKFLCESAGAETKKPSTTIPHNGTDCLKLLLGLGPEIGFMPWCFNPDGSIEAISLPNEQISHYTTYEKFFVPNVEGALKRYPGAIPFSHINDILAELGHGSVNIVVGESKGVSITNIGQQISKGSVVYIYCVLKKGNGKITCVPPLRTNDVIEPAENAKDALMGDFPNIASLINSKDLLIIYKGSGGGSGAGAVLVSIVSALVAEKPREFAVSVVHKTDGSLSKTGCNIEKAATCKDANLGFVSADNILAWQCTLNGFFRIKMPQGFGNMHFCYSVKELLQLLFTEEALRKEYPQEKLTNKDLEDMNLCMLQGCYKVLKYSFNYGSTAAFAGLAYYFWDKRSFRLGMFSYSLWRIYQASRLQ